MAPFTCTQLGVICEWFTHPGCLHFSINNTNIETVIVETCVPVVPSVHSMMQDPYVVTPAAGSREKQTERQQTERHQAESDGEET